MVQPSSAVAVVESISTSAGEKNINVNITVIMCANKICPNHSMSLRKELNILHNKMTFCIYWLTILTNTELPSWYNSRDSTELNWFIAKYGCIHTFFSFLDWERVTVWGWGLGIVTVAEGKAALRRSVVEGWSKWVSSPWAGPVEGCDGGWCQFCSIVFQLAQFLNPWKTSQLFLIPSSYFFLSTWSFCVLMHISGIV